jgi:hypothetical protein
VHIAVGHQVKKFDQIETAMVHCDDQGAYRRCVALSEEPDVDRPLLEVSACTLDNGKVGAEMLSEVKQGPLTWDSGIDKGLSSIIGYILR